MPDLSFSPIGDTAAVAALLWTVWRERSSKKAFAARTPSTVQKKSSAVQKVVRTYPTFGQAEGAPVGAPLAG
jgi:hypothetical protein